MLDRTNTRLMDLIKNQLARPTGKPGPGSFRPLGWMMRGIDAWEANQPEALADLRSHARQGVLDLYDFLTEQPATFSCSPEEFILGYKPAVEVAVPMEQVAKLEAWYRSRQEITRAVTEVAGILVPAQEAWSRIRARLG
jgi:hypothetical protein